ncbi:hypothetical protein N7495_003314 [Penicillium taxi]|uniref:uncharacterized protein n=1 Tax=Penicillium taxi TaxID=168475 RepID=UPI0025457EC9|nr:uncharacterized protein N7495_003314 [Penicillium taxi]KAJ5902786.1 hypothetical protein N7495_003314 [Penicillium taxi]
MENHWNRVLSIIVLLVCLPNVWADHPGKHEAIRTSSGLIQGHAASRKREVTEYLGIPYASPPIGKLRFAVPEAYNLNVNDTIQASSWGPNCPGTSGAFNPYPHATPQAARILKNFANNHGIDNEDCLYLNVWTRPSKSILKPVMLWIHGGRFEVGGSHSPYYDGQELVAEHDVVIVTINYRMNIFGFSGAPGLTQNVGLLDQRMAIEWVHRNIAAFGGDKNRITLFGGSAGGASIDMYSYAYAHDPLVHGIICQSGTALSFVPNTAEQSASYFNSVSSMLDCGDDGDQAVECVRGKPFESVLNASNQVPSAYSPALDQPLFQPTVDGVIVFDNYINASATGRFARIPLLVNSNKNEAGFYRIIGYSSNVSLTDKQWHEFNLAAFNCPSAATVRDRVNHQVPTWQSRYFGDWANLRLYPTSGTYHGAEVPLLFGNAELISGINNTDQENKFARYLSSAWVAFATDPKNGLKAFGWPRYNPHIHLPRIASLLTRHNLTRFTRRILCDAEQSDFQTRFKETLNLHSLNYISKTTPFSARQPPITPDMTRWLAGRFAAKEAARKAAPGGAASIGWKDVMVRVQDVADSTHADGVSRPPEIVYLGLGDGTARVGRLSISHDGEYVVATVLAAG